jgi:hypothetical protein
MRLTRGGAAAGRREHAAGQEHVGRNDRSSGREHASEFVGAEQPLPTSSPACRPQPRGASSRLPPSASSRACPLPRMEKAHVGGDMVHGGSRTTTRRLGAWLGREHLRPAPALDVAAACSRSSRPADHRPPALPGARRGPG